MLKTHRRSIFVAIALIILAAGAFLMANVELAAVVACNFVY